MHWILAFGIAFIIVAAVFIFSRWLEKKNYSQQFELLRRKQERLDAGLPIRDENEDGEEFDEHEQSDSVKNKDEWLGERKD